MVATRNFGTVPRTLAGPRDWLVGLGITAASMEGTGVYWSSPFRSLEEAGIRAELVHPRHCKQVEGRMTDIADSVWLARACQCGLAQPSFVPPPGFADLRPVCR